MTVLGEKRDGRNLALVSNGSTASLDGELDAFAAAQVRLADQEP